MLQFSCWSTSCSLRNGNSRFLSYNRGQKVSVSQINNILISTNNRRLGTLWWSYWCIAGMHIHNHSPFTFPLKKKENTPCKCGCVHRPWRLLLSIEVGPFLSHGQWHVSQSPIGQCWAHIVATWSYSPLLLDAEHKAEAGKYTNLKYV